MFAPGPESCQYVHLTVLHGSAATSLGCGGISNNRFVANFLLS